MTTRSVHAVTGAYGYSGKYIAQRLLDAGHPVITFTNSGSRANPFGDRVPAFPFDFAHPDGLVESLRNVSVLSSLLSPISRASPALRYPAALAVVAFLHAVDGDLHIFFDLEVEHAGDDEVGPIAECVRECDSW